MNGEDEARAEAERRWPIGFGTVGESRRKLYDFQSVFMTGALWQASRDAAEIAALTAQLQAAQAEAWDEGWDAHENSGCEDMCGVCAVCLPDNPYRASIEQTEAE